MELEVDMEQRCRSHAYLILCSPEELGARFIEAVWGRSKVFCPRILGYATPEHEEIDR